MSALPTVDELNASLLGVREGRVTADAFFRLARRKLGFVARDIWRGWRRKLPAWVELEDVEQVLREQVLVHVPQWRPERSERIWDFVIWSATHRTQRQIHKWRGAVIHGNEGRNESRAELAFSKVFRPRDGAQEADVESRIDAILVRAKGVEERPEEDVDRAAKFDEVLQRAETVREATVLRALQGCDGSVLDAAAALWGDFSARVELGLAREEQAMAAVREVLQACARRHVIEVPLDLFDDAEEAVA